MNTGSSLVHFLWLMPEADSHARLGGVIRDLAAHFGLDAFDPHVTLLGGVRGEAIDLVERTRSLAQTLAPFPIAISEVEHGEQYFRCIVLAATLDPVLAAARAEAELILGTPTTREVFSPHLSLLYGELSPAIRKQICNSIDGTYPVSFEVDRLQLVAGAPDHRDWRTVAVFDLMGQAS